MNKTFTLTLDKIGIVVTMYNRAHLSRMSLESIKNTLWIPLQEVILMLVDDCSDEPAAIEVFEQFSIQDILLYKTRLPFNVGIKKTLHGAIETLFDEFNCDVVINLDNDVLVKPRWILELNKLYKLFPDRIITGFHSTTKNKDGSDRHPIITEQTNSTYVKKRSVGGINMMFNKEVYTKYIQPALGSTGNWDHNACLNLVANNLSVICATPSLIQHTGIHKSTLGHDTEMPDVAEGFYIHELPSVTLVGADTNHPHELEYAAAACQQEIKFGGVKLFTHQQLNITSKHDYSRFILQDLYKWINTDHILIIQGDGYIVNPSAWNDEWLNYDYIGATWLYKDGMNVGNGGFSLRSKKLMEFIANNMNYIEIHPEDHHICRTWRKGLERNGFKFAPEEVANQFSIEAYGSEKLPGANKYSGQFGFHGWNVDWSEAPFEPPKNLRKRLRVAGGKYIEV